MGIRPFKSKESETDISWSAASDFHVEGFQVATSDFVDRYDSEKANKGDIKKLYVAEVSCDDGSAYQLPVVELKANEMKIESAVTKVASKLKSPHESANTTEKVVVKIRPYVSKQKEANVSWDVTAPGFDLEGYQVANTQFVDEYSNKKAIIGKTKKLYVAEINCTDGTSFQVPVVKEKEDKVKSQNAQIKLVSKQKLPSEKLKFAERASICIRPYTSKESETSISWDNASDFGVEGYEVASSDVVDKYTSEKVEKGEVKKLYVAEIKRSDGSIFQIPVLKEKDDIPTSEKAQTKLVSKQKPASEKIQKIEKTEIKIRPFKSKESETDISWSAASDFHVEGFQVATSDFVDRYDSEKANKGDIKKLYVAEVSCDDGSAYQLPVVELKANEMKIESAVTKVASKLKSPHESANKNKQMYHGMSLRQALILKGIKWPIPNLFMSI